jgi:hypothetical protein
MQLQANGSVMLWETVLSNDEQTPCGVVTLLKEALKRNPDGQTHCMMSFVLVVAGSLSELKLVIHP